MWGSHQGGAGFGNYTAKAACCYCGGGLDRAGGAAGNETIGMNDDTAPSIPRPTSPPASSGGGTSSTGAANTIGGGRMGESSASSLRLSLLIPITLMLVGAACEMLASSAL